MPIDPNEIGGFVSHCTNVMWLINLGRLVAARITEIATPECMSKLEGAEREMVRKATAHRSAETIGRMRLAADEQAAREREAAASHRKAELQREAAEKRDDEVVADRIIQPDGPQPDDEPNDRVGELFLIGNPPPALAE